MRIHLLLALTIATGSGCQFGLPTGTKSRPSARAPVAAEVSRLIAQSGIATEFTGKARILSDNGLGIISNNSGAILSDNGLGLISDNSAGIVSNNAGGLQSRYGVLAGSARQESLLADAKIEVLDAQGRLLVDAAKKPITAMTDKKGAYRFKAVLPAENLVLRVKLWNGGVLYGILAYDPAGGTRTFELNTASTLGAHYVLEKFVKKRKEVLDRLPLTEAEGLFADMETARQHLPAKAPSYKPAELLALAEDLRKKDTTLNQRLDQIEAILLAGQANLGTGLQATQVSLGFPTAVVGDAAGNLFIAEAGASRIRRVNKDGTVAVTAANGIGIPRNMIMSPEGDLIVADVFANLVKRVSKDGKISVVAGNGGDQQSPAGGQARDMGIYRPQALAYGPDGTLYIGELTKDAGRDSRLLTVGKDGVVTEIDATEIRQAKTNYSSMVVDKDGTLYVVDGKNGRLAKRSPQGAWTVLTDKQLYTEYSMLLLTRDGRLLVSETDGHRIVAVGADGTTTTIVGVGTPGYAGDGGAATAAQLNGPAGMWEGPDGTLYFADAGNSMVRAIDRSGRIRTVAGVNGLLTQGDALAIAINSPTAIALDPQNRLVISETSGNTIKRLEDGKLTIIAGSTKGFGGDDGPATAAQLDTPTSIAYSGEDLYVLDTVNNRVRRIDAQGTITTVAGSDNPMPLIGQTSPAFERIGKRLFGMAIAPDGMPVWSDNDGHQIIKLRKDNQVELIAGTPGGDEGDAGDGEAAVGAKMKFPSGLAYDAKGNLYVADAYFKRVRKIDTTGAISTLVAHADWDSLGGLVVAPDGTIYTSTKTAIYKIATDKTVTQVAGGPAGTPATGPVSSVRFSGITDLTMDPVKGYLYALDASRVIVEIKGTDAVLLGGAFSGVGGIDFQPDGSLMMADAVNRKIFLLKDWIKSSGARSRAGGQDGDGGPATQAAMCNPSKLAVGKDGAIYTVDVGFVRRIKDGTITTVIGKTAESGTTPVDQAQLRSPKGLWYDAASHALMIAELWRVRKWDLGTNQMSTIAGAGLTGAAFQEGGAPTASSLVDMFGLAQDASGALTYLANDGALKRRLVRQKDGKLQTLAGNGTDLTPAGLLGQLDKPALDAAVPANCWAVAVKGELAFYALLVAGTPNQAVVLQVTPGGNVTELCRVNSDVQAGALAVTPDGHALLIGALSGIHKYDFATRQVTAVATATDADLNTPRAMGLPSNFAFDAAGALYYADYAIGRVNRLNLATGAITLIAGKGAPLLAGSRVDDGLTTPWGVAIDRDGNLYISDTGANQIKTIPAAQLPR
ncbi:MAG: NHL repeat-containing protein [Candidatus Sericytochromatia bacterium]